MSEAAEYMAYKTALIRRKRVGVRKAAPFEAAQVKASNVVGSLT